MGRLRRAGRPRRGRGGRRDADGSRHRAAAAVDPAALPAANGSRGVTWKRDVSVEPAAVARGAFLAARGLGGRPRIGGADPLVAVAAGAWRAMATHAASAPVEVGGFLVGEAFRDEAGRWLIDARWAIPALGAVEEATYFRLTEAAWEHVSGARAALDPDLLTVGWYHTHPGLGAFFSGTDRASQRAFFNRPWNVGVVIDPVRDDLALFCGADSVPLDPGWLVVYDEAAAPIGGEAPADAAAAVGAPGDGPVPAGAVSGRPVAEAPASVTPRGALSPPWQTLAILVGALAALALAARAAGRRRRLRRRR